MAASDSIRQILEQTRKIGDSFLPVLIQGETGTGKELIARALHQLGHRASGPFMPVNCAAIAPELLDSELFGHVRGAYTGANESQGGLFEAADKGTLFLDEIGEATPQFQAHLLRIIEEQAVRRVGDQRLRSIDVRIVAATNRDVQQAIAQGRFRQDLYFRLQGKELYLPPLRERRDDIPHLIAHVLELWSRRRNNPRPAITRKAMAILMGYAWPGNVRELIHLVEQAAEEINGRIITPAHLAISSPRRVISAPAGPDERLRISAALRATEGNVSAAARRLDISRNTMYRHMRRLGIKSR